MNDMRHRMFIKNLTVLATILGVFAVSANAVAGGKETYETACQVCHAAGVAGAPKFGDKAAWKDRIAKGKDTLYEHSIKGFNAMPPKGGNMSLSDDDVKAAVDYMVSKVQ
ncbi:MAG: c-type cytochrome [Acidiferrobacterales bacterium]